MFRSASFLVLSLLLLPQAADARHGHHSLARSSTAAAKPAAEAKTDARPAGAEEAATDGAPRRWWPPAAQVGPAKVALAGQATLDLPAGFVFLNKADSKALMEKLGNRASDSDIGTILPQDISQKKFFVTVEWAPAGYVKDDEADKLDKDAILDSIRKGTEAANEFRKERGFKPVSVVGWGEPPRYERAAHHIVWAVIGKVEDHQTVNFNTRLLGRGGYLSLNLVCGIEQLAGLKPTMQDLLGRATFDGGKRYADFLPGKDKVAEFGLAALIVGGAAVAGKTALKVGILAKFGKVLLGLILALKKAFILLLIGIGAILKRLFAGRGSSDDQPKPPTPTDTPVAP